ncbi:zinc finger protein 839 isoform X2 [Dipodomys merriami]|uniref:zinc finger protein 839 isoform X2 n=1 Tax=Dipodomys merriami TaxID=94247 RepID=UPI003855A108
MPPLATIQPEAARQSQLLPATNPSLVGLCVVSPQLLRVQPLGRTGSPLSLPRSPPQPPACRVFVQRPLPALQPLPTWEAPALSGQATTLSPWAAAGQPPAMPPLSSAARGSFSSLPAKHTGKPKRSLKVKTRSGRISRPPKFKARDYKFIKTEGLADGHPSDSDDYSELSVEEEEEQKEPWALFHLESCALQPRAFKCQTCEKSYIGKGGLARHLKLNPSHSPLKPEKSLIEKANGSLTQECVEAGGRGLASPEWKAPVTLNKEGADAAVGGLQNGQSVEVEDTRVPEPENGSQSALLGSEDQGRRHGGSETLTEHSRAIRQRGRAAALRQRPAVAARLRAQLEESLQQCGREDLVELVLPRLAQVVTVYEFLLMKVEKSHLAKPFFPAIYKEFEELHNLVKKTCQDYLSSVGPCPREPLEISNDKVAESLGITEEFLQQKEIHPDCTARKHVSAEMHVDKLEGAGRQKRECEAAGEGLATGKRPRRPVGPSDSPEPLVVDSRDLEESRPLCVTAACEGFPPPVGGRAPLLRAGSLGTMVSDGDGGTLLAGQKLVAAALADLEWTSGCAGPALRCRCVTEPAHCTQVEEPGGSPSAPEAVLPEEKALAHAADLHTADGQRRPAGHGTMAARAGGEPPLGTEAANLGQLSGSHLDGQQACPSHILLVDATGPLLENVSPMDMAPEDAASSTGPEPEPHPGPDRLLSATGSTGSHARGASQLSCAGARVGPGELESKVAVGDAQAFTVTSRCQEGQENILTQSHLGTLMSQEDVVIVTDTEGSPVLKVGLPEKGSSWNLRDTSHCENRDSQ